MKLLEESMKYFFNPNMRAYLEDQTIPYEQKRYKVSK